MSEFAFPIDLSTLTARQKKIVDNVFAKHGPGEHLKNMVKSLRPQKDAMGLGVLFVHVVVSVRSLCEFV